VAARPLIARVSAGTTTAAVMGIVFSGVTLLMALLQGSVVLRFRHGNSISLWAVLGTYLLVGPLTGALFGALFPATRTPLGAYVTGIAASVPLVAAVTMGFAGFPSGWTRTEWIAIALMLVAFSGPGGLIVRRISVE